MHRSPSLGRAWELAGRAVPSRVLFGPHETNLCRGRAFSERCAAYYARRAAGGCGVVVTEEASVHPSDWPYERAPLASECGPGWRRLVEAVRPHGTLLVAALGHAGGQGSSAYSQRELWAPGRVPEVNTREVPKQMEQADVDAVVAGFVAATRTALAAGCAGVEVNAGQYSLVRQFLSGLTNTRPDGYGADRVRFAREVLAAVREAAGGAVVGLRLSCDELAPWAGLTPESAAGVAVALAGFVDYLVVVRGSIFSAAGTRPDMHDEPGFNRELCRGVRAALDGTGVAVVLQGSVVDPAMAQAALDDATADAVEMTRAQIADPDLVAKTRAGLVPRPCILCNQTCQVRDPRNPLVSCVGEPSAGHETHDVPLGATSTTSATSAASAARAPAPREVTVVGGGPAGLEAARVAAARGHRVRLVERAPELGGTVLAASRGAGRARLRRLTDWLAAECERLGVEIRTGTEAAAPAEGGADADIVAVGGRDGPPAFTVEDGAVVLSARALLSPGGDDLLPAGPVVVWDPVGNWTAVSVAELLAASGREVTLMTPDLVVAVQLARTGDLAPANVRLHQAGVRLVKRTSLRRVTAAAAHGADLYSDDTLEIPCAAVVACASELPATWPGPEGGLAGDAVAPRTIYEAVLEGRRAALALERAPRGVPGVAVP